MLWNIALRTLLCDRGKLITGLVGVVFSVVLVNVQGGLFFGLINKASLLVDRSGADIWVGHRGMHNVDFPHHIPERWIHRIRSLPAVAEAEPIRIGFSEFSLPDGNFEGTTVVGIQRHSDLGRVFEIADGPADALDHADGVVVDAWEDHKLHHPKLGELREIGGKRARIVAKSRGLVGFLVTPYAFTTYDRALEYVGGDPSMASYFLVRVKPGEDVDQVCRQIQQRLTDVTAMTTSQYARTSIQYWTMRTGMGLSFGAATVLGLLVGLVMVAQTLYAMVLDRISEFATLKAIGSSERELLFLLFAQSSSVAGIGIVIGLIVSVIVRHLFSTPRTMIEIPLWLYAVSAVLVFVICLTASALPYLRVRRVDPHSVLQS